MTVYVDDARIPAAVNGSWSAIWCHLTADTPDELHAFAARIGLRRSWFQDPTRNTKQIARPGSFAAELWHYDVTETKRRAAVRAGAREVTTRELLAITRQRWEAAREAHGATQ